ncbi:MAG: cation acetate symporter [Bacteroidetes bacterium GWF2_41_61]|nr:MAG: cation acetate symporter [Bacteroidetes bacterium GWE2_40_15]OFY26527.1 MAG: cation acetate symporter [Bacteroidetes bacterium GWF2_41_61]OFY90954.1 MAG: cation acetate symporter [Bacteroidetes bacterium RIFOXYA12_FULL_40_10]HBG24543.1 cation acetate symporter [Rikenellaceae bacterium]HBZ26227.1 cation acetate symporter [Rikenellaceae bacterium]
MIYNVSIWAIIIFLTFVAAVLGLSFYFARKTKSAAGYYAAGGNIHWGVNGIAFAGDYLSAASFLGICGMIAYSGYDGFLYSIGYLAGWVVALFIVAEPMKRLGKYTFTDALDARFNSKAIKLTAAISTLIVSIFYLIPQMVGAGDLVVPLLGLPHWVGVVIVGSIVIFIVATAGMTSTTYVQFIKGALLIIFSTILTIYILNNGFTLNPGKDYHKFTTIGVVLEDQKITGTTDPGYVFKESFTVDNSYTFVKTDKGGVDQWFKLSKDSTTLEEVLFITTLENGTKLYNGEPKSAAKFYQVGHLSKIVVDGVEVDKTGPLGPFEFLSTMENSQVVRFAKKEIKAAGTTVWYQNITDGKNMIKPGLLYKISKSTGATPWDRVNFVSLMLALFLGTSALPHILIRYYTVSSQRAARKSTIVAIAAIGFFYILTLYMGLGASVNGVLDVESSNMSGPLLAKYFGIGIFSIISAIAFATVLGTVSGLIVASSGAIAHDFMDKYLNMKMDDKRKVKAGKLAAFGVGLFAILLGILFKGMNVSFLVGLAFSVAASANLPAILFLLFWDKTTAKGIAWSIVTGILSSVILILFSPTMYEKYGLAKAAAPFPIDNPGIISIPLAVIVLVVVSLLTQKHNATKVENYHHDE